MPTKDPVAKARHSRTYYQRHKEAIKAKVAARTAVVDKEIRDFLSEYLLAHPCVDCGETDPMVLEFDHRDPSQKKFNVTAGLYARYSMKRVKAEIEKCDIRCANCHRRKTIKQFGYWKWEVFGAQSEASSN